MISVVIPVKGREDHLKNCLRSLELQTIEHDVDVIEYDTWTVSRARNIGIRRAPGTIIVCVDADLILEPRVLETLVELHGLGVDYITTQVRMLFKADPPHRALPLHIELPRDYPILLEHSMTRPEGGGLFSMGWGGIYSSPREWWFKVRGFDERLDVEHHEDVDLYDRAKRDGRKMVKLNFMGREGTKIYHQYHERKVDLNTRNRILDDDKTIIRNDENWGLSLTTKHF